MLHYERSECCNMREREREVNAAIWERKREKWILGSSVKLSKLIDPIEEVSYSCIHIGKSRFCTSRSEGCYSCQMPSITNLTLKWSTGITMTRSFTANLSSCTQVPLSNSNFKLGEIGSVTFTIIIHLNLYFLKYIWSTFIWSLIKEVSIN